MSILLFVLALALLIFVHEFGHFIVAKKSGIRVDEFGFGFPPRLYGVKRGETTYSINLLPFGGFVKIFGENPDQESISGADSARSMVHKPKHVQAAVLVAGVVFNLVLAWLLLSLGFLAGMPVSTASSLAGSGPARLLITSVEPGSPADLAGLRSGDEIVQLSAGDAQSELSPTSVQSFISEHGETSLNLAYRRTGELTNVELRPVAGIIAERPAIGIAMDQVVLTKLPLFPALWQGGKLVFSLTIATVVGLWQVLAQAFSGGAVLEQITGPIGLVGLVGEAAGLGAAYLLSFVAFISINLAVLNLIPFPALDGGRLLFLLIEKIKGSAIKPQVANALNLAGFALLLLLMLVVTYGDIRRLLF